MSCGSKKTPTSCCAKPPTAKPACCGPSQCKASGPGSGCDSGSAEDVRSDVKTHYGKQSNCCAQDMSPDTKMSCPSKLTPPAYVRDILKQLHPEVTAKYYGCGVPIPEALEGCAVLDLGCGTGRDVFLCSKLVGSTGKVVGIDMTPEQLAVARSYVDYHKQKFGFSNVEFCEGIMEELDGALAKVSAPSAFDVIISNCVVNLCLSKQAVLEKAFSVLKAGGEFYFSDTYCETEIPDSLKKDKFAWSECFSGALCWDNFVELVRKVGFKGPFVTASADYFPVDDHLKQALAGYKFWSRTVRLFKPTGLAFLNNQNNLTYNGQIAETTQEFAFDFEHIFKAGQETTVSSELVNIIKGSRYAKFFN